jgi:hypothetical protein
MKISVLALALSILPAAPSFAQTTPAPPAERGAPEKAASGKSLLENEQIKVREIKLAPGARQAGEQRPNTFLYALTDGSIVFTPPGRKGYELTFRAGEALWLPSQETAVANESDKEVRALIVEIKARAPAGQKGKAPAKGKKGSKKGAAKG